MAKWERGAHFGLKLIASLLFQVLGICVCVCVRVSMGGWDPGGESLSVWHSPQTSSVSAPPIPTLVQNCQRSSNLQIPLWSDAPEQASHSRQAFKLGNVGLDSEGWNRPTFWVLPVLGMDLGRYLCKFRHGSLGSCAGESSGMWEGFAQMWAWMEALRGQR